MKKETTGDMLADKVKFDEMQEEIEHLKACNKARENQVEFYVEVAEEQYKRFSKAIRKYHIIITLMALPVLFTLWCIIISIK